MMANRLQIGIRLELGLNGTDNGLATYETLASFDPMRTRVAPRKALEELEACLGTCRAD